MLSYLIKILIGKVIYNGFDNGYGGVAIFFKKKISFSQGTKTLKVMEK